VFVLEVIELEGPQLQVIIQFLVLDAQLPMHSVDLVDLILKLEAQRDLLIEGLLSLLVILHKHVLIILQVLVLISQQLKLLEDLGVALLVDVLIIVNQLLPPLDLLLQHLHLPRLVPLDLPDHCVEVPIRTVLQQDGVHLPERLAQVHIPPPDFAKQSVEAHRVHEE
jgi:hypothetical protein